MRQSRPNLSALILFALVVTSACGGDSDISSLSVEADPSGEPSDAALPQEAASEPDAEPEPEPEPELMDTLAASAQLRADIDELVFEDSSALLDECPTGKHTTFTRLTNLIPEELHADVGLTSEIDAQVSSSANAIELPISGTALLGCGSSVDDKGAGLDIAPAPSDIEAFLREFNDPESIGDVEYEITPSGAHEGGEFLHIAVDTIDGTEFPFSSREVVWLDDNMMVIVYAYGPIAFDIDLEQVEAALVVELPTIIAIAAS